MRKQKIGQYVVQLSDCLGTLKNVDQTNVISLAAIDAIEDAPSCAFLHLQRTVGWHEVPWRCFLGRSVRNPVKIHHSPHFNTSNGVFSDFMNNLLFLDAFQYKYVALDLLRKNRLAYVKKTRFFH